MSRTANSASSDDLVARHDQQVQSMLHWLDGRLRGLPSEPREEAQPDVDVAAILRRPQPERPEMPSCPATPRRPAVEPARVSPEGPVLTRIAAYERSVLSHIQNRNAQVGRRP